jgi:hypothetical protein
MSLKRQVLGCSNRGNVTSARSVSRKNAYVQTGIEYASDGDLVMGVNQRPSWCVKRAVRLC